MNVAGWNSCANSFSFTAYYFTATNSCSRQEVATCTRKPTAAHPSTLAGVYHEHKTTLPTLQQHQFRSCSWPKNISTNKRHSSVPPQQDVGATTRTGPDEQQSPLHHHHLQPEYPARATPTSQHHLAAIMTPRLAGTALLTHTPSDVGSSGGGPRGFPTPNFSAAVKVVETDGSFTLVSQTTGRRWRSVNSSRQCQFGEVLRAVELADAGPSAYFAIKV